MSDFTDNIVDEANAVIGIGAASVKGGLRAVAQGTIPILVFGATTAIAVGLVLISSRWIRGALNG